MYMEDITTDAFTVRVDLIIQAAMQVMPFAWVLYVILPAPPSFLLFAHSGSSNHEARTDDKSSHPI